MIQESDINRILNFLLRKETTNDFEFWVHNDKDLESKIGCKLYSELISIDYKDEFVLDKLRGIIIGRYVSHTEYENFKYISILQDSGWYQNRVIEIDFSKNQMTPEIKNAVKIIEEFGGLKFTSSEKKVNCTTTYVEFLDSLGEVRNMKEFGLDKNLVNFATALNDHINLFVDENNQFYQLDKVVCEHLYEYRGQNFENMMREFLQLEKNNNFYKIENPHLEVLRNKRKKMFDKFKKSNG